MVIILENEGAKNLKLENMSFVNVVCLSNHMNEIMFFETIKMMSEKEKLKVKFKIQIIFRSKKIFY